jgi:hypothetical protein
MRYFIIIAAMLSATSLTAGGWEASRLDTKFMYEKGSYAEMSHAAIDYDVKSKNLEPITPKYIVERSVKKSQTRTAMAFKTSYKGFDVGVTRFKSGTIQLVGTAAGYGGGSAGPVPAADVNLNTLTIMSKLNLGENVDLLLGLNRNTLDDGTVTTTRGKYTITGESNVGSLVGFAFSKPEIAMRVEILAQPKSEMKVGTSLVTSAYGKSKFAAPCSTPTNDTAKFNSSLSRPATLTMNFQSGVAADTLVFGSIHRTDWSGAQIDVPSGCPATSTGSVFWDTTTYTLGAGRKVSDSLSLTASVAKETGGNSTTSSLFTTNNGYSAVNLGAQYTVGKVKISGGYNYTKLGNVTVTDGTYNHATYTGNKVSAFALKVGVNF